MKSKTNSNRAFFIKLGLALSLGITLVAFEWQEYGQASFVDFGATPPDIEDPVVIPITEQERPKPQKMLKVVVVEDSKDVDTLSITDFFPEPTDTSTIIIDEPIEPEPIEPDPVEPVDEVFDRVEKNATPKGGMKAFYKYIRKNLKYPRQAKRMGIEGKVFIQFVVDKTGALTQIKLVRGIGGGCDEEALRIIGDAPQWEPGKQRGRPVKQRITFPINFKLK